MRVFVVESAREPGGNLEDQVRAAGHGVCGSTRDVTVAVTEVPRVKPDVVVAAVDAGPDPHGLALVDRLRDADVPVVLVSDSPMAEIAVRVARGESLAWVARPVDPRWLAADIALACARHQARAALRDLTERVRVVEAREREEARQRHARWMESLGTLAGGIAHDFNNLLAAITANAEIAAWDIAPEDPGAESLREISAAAGRASDLVKEILAFSRRGPARRTLAPVGDVVSQASRALQATVPAGIQVTAVVAPDVPLAVIDTQQIHQVLVNLGTNAWQAIARPTGNVSLRASLVTLSTEDVAPHASPLVPGRYVQLQVTDDGAGMDNATRARMFEPFFTTRGVGRGRGMGLAVVHGVVADHGGAVAVESTPGRGTTVTVYLPAGNEAMVAPTARDGATVPGSAGRVVLIDDEETLLRATRRLMEGLGYTVTGFTVPTEALAVLRAAPMDVDLVVTDQHMPEMGGVDVALALLAIRPELPVVMVSGDSGNEDLVVPRNITARLAKPFSLAQLASVLGSALGRG